MMTCSDCALVICIGNRYFSHFGKKQSVQTAWCLAGAELFVYHRIKEVTDILDSKNRKYEIKRVVLKELKNE